MVDTGTVLVLRVELPTVFHGAQPSVLALEVPDADELEELETEVVEDEVVLEDEEVVVDEMVVDEVVVEELEDPHEAPALTEN